MRRASLLRPRGSLPGIRLDAQPGPEPVIPVVPVVPVVSVVSERPELPRRAASEVGSVPRSRSPSPSHHLAVPSTAHGSAVDLASASAQPSLRSFDTGQLQRLPTGSTASSVRSFRLPGGARLPWDAAFSSHREDAMHSAEALVRTLNQHIVSVAASLASLQPIPELAVLRSLERDPSAEVGAGIVRWLDEVRQQVLAGSDTTLIESGVEAVRQRAVAQPRAVDGGDVADAPLQIAFLLSSGRLTPGQVDRLADVIDKPAVPKNDQRQRHELRTRWMGEVLSRMRGYSAPAACYQALLERMERPARLGLKISFRQPRVARYDLHRLVAEHGGETPGPHPLPPTVQARLRQLRDRTTRVDNPRLQSPPPSGYATPAGAD